VRLVVEEGLLEAPLVRRLCAIGAVVVGHTWSGADSVLRGAPLAVGRAPQLAPFTHGVCGHGRGGCGLMAGSLQELADAVARLEGAALDEPVDWSSVTIRLGEVPPGLPVAVSPPATSRASPRPTAGRSRCT
jgi:hypothetical protein